MSADARTIAASYLDVRRPEMAEKTLRESLAAQPGDAATHAYLAVILAQQQKLDAALIEVREALRLAPEYAYAHESHSRVLRASGKFDDAFTAVTESLRLNPLSCPSWRLMGRLLIDQKSFATAIECLEPALKLFPDDAWLLTNLSWALSADSQPERAEQMARAALHRDASFVYAKQCLAEALLKQKRTEEARQLLVDVLRKTPDDEWTVNSLRKTYEAELRAHLKANDTIAVENGIADFRLRFPDSPFSWNCEAELYVRKLDFKEARRCFYEAQYRDLNDESSLWGLKYYQPIIGDPSEILERWLVNRLRFSQKSAAWFANDGLCVGSLILTVLTVFGLRWVMGGF